MIVKINPDSKVDESRGGIIYNARKHKNDNHKEDEDEDEDEDGEELRNDTNRAISMIEMQGICYSLTDIAPPPPSDCQIS